MEKNGKDSNGAKKEFISDMDDDEFSEVKSLLPANVESPRHENKVRRKVQWNDNNGNKLVEVLVFEPSEASDSDEEDSDACICIVM